MEDQMDLPPGFRFHPTDEELITHYLCKKVIDGGFSPTAIGDVDLNKCEPWDLPVKAKMGEKERYFFCVRDRKYPTGLRTNRATKAGYWKATGKDKEIFRGKVLIGMKKTLVFYVGRAPKGEKSNWVMHEFRLEGKFSFHSLPKAAQNEWVISRVFQKSSCGKKTQITGMTKVNPFENSFNSSLLPPLMDSPPYDPKSSDPTNVPCFSSAMYFPRNPEKIIDSFDDGNNNPIFPRIHHLPNSSYPALETPIQGSWQQFQNPISLQGTEMHQGFKTEREMVSGSQETGVSTEANNEISSVIISNLQMGRRPFQDQAVPPEFDCLWNY